MFDLDIKKKTEVDLFCIDYRFQTIKNCEVVNLYGDYKSLYKDFLGDKLMEEVSLDFALIKCFEKYLFGDYKFLVEIIKIKKGYESLLYKGNQVSKPNSYDDIKFEINKNGEELWVYRRVSVKLDSEYIDAAFNSINENLKINVLSLNMGIKEHNETLTDACSKKAFQLSELYKNHPDLFG